MNSQSLGKSDQSTASDDDSSKKKAEFREYRVNLWDTHGMERFHSIPASQIKKADAIVLLYDLTDKQTFTGLHDWLNKIEDISRAHVPIILVGNKNDMESDIAVSEKEQKDLENERKVRGFRISAREDADAVR